ncbi:MAG: succinylglutamate desuccinylase/aspartoacylase family protein [Myxococcota bacterium]|nr:succinylglutamate desuccinylase/aspartoacylase family protein [Myxococcota bacterium]
MNPISVQIAEFTWHAPKAGAARWAIVGSLHGDEPEGARLIEELIASEPPRWAQDCPVDLLLVIGNPLALQRNQRGSVPGADLNRFFGIHTPSGPAYEQERAQYLRELLEPVDVVIDIHQAKLPIPLLAVIEDTPHHLTMASRAGVEMAVIGADKIYGSTMLADWVNRKGGLGITLETGQAHTPAALEQAHLAVQRLLQFESSTPARPPSTYEIECALPSPGEDFEFARPLVNGTSVLAGETLGMSTNGAITAPGNGIVFLPREGEPPGEPCMLFARERSFNQ